MNIYRPVSTIMTTSLKTVLSSSVMTEVADIFENHSFHHIPVISEEHFPVGVISRHDYNQLQHHFTRNGWEIAEASNKRYFQSLTADEVMTSCPITLDKDEPITEAVNVFLNNRIHSIIITDVGLCVGIVTPYDLIRELKKLSTVMQ